MRKQSLLRLTALVAALLMLLCTLPAMAAAKTIDLSAADYPVEQDGRYSTMEEVAVYLATYGELPQNFLTKNEAENLGWDNRAGNLDEVAPGCSIGGNRFGNYEGILPDAKGRKWTECDINYTGGYRGGERICFSNDGLIYYTDDHYNSFKQVIVSFDAPPAAEAVIDLDVEVEPYGEYTSLAEVAVYIHTYGELPCNYITKSDAKDLGWSNKKDNLGQVAPGFTIGGDTFQNREKLLPNAKGREWFECDVEVTDGSRSDVRIVYSSDGLIYYTTDGYKTFTQLY